VTAAAAVDVTAAESIDIVELSPDIISMSPILHARDRDPLRDSRARLHLEDGRYFLQATHERYDLITGEPPPPRTGNAVNIYTRDYFQLVHNRLAEGGLATYWLPVGRPIPGTNVNAIIRAFCDVFEDCSLWNGTPSDLMLVGSRGAAGAVSATAMAAAWASAPLASRLREVGFEVPQQIGATFIGDSVYLKGLMDGARPVTDDFPQRLRPVANRPSISDTNLRDDGTALALFRHVIDTNRARQAFAASPMVRRLWPEDLIQETLPWFEYQAMVNDVLLEGAHPLRHIEQLHKTLTTTSLRTLPLWMLGSDELKQRIVEESEAEEGTAHEAAEGGHRRPERAEVAGATRQRAFMRGVGAMAARDYLSAAAEFQHSDRPLLVYALSLAGERQVADQLAHMVDPADPDERHFWQWLGRTFRIGPFALR
jgi:hypothetical protein